MKSVKILALALVAVFLIPFACGTTGSCGAVSSSAFYAWLGDSGIPEYSISGAYRANYSTFVKYNLVVYGKPNDVSGNELREGEYRYLGFTFSEGKYTNLEFPNDETGNLPPEQWDYVDVYGAAESWDSLEQSVQKPYMLYTQLIGHGAKDLTAADIGVSRAKVQSAASWNSSGSIYTFKSNGFYATFTIPSMGPGFLSADMYPDDPIIFVNPEMEDISTGVNLTASVNKPASEIKHIKIIFSSGDWRKVRYYYDANSIDIDIDAMLNVPDEIPGEIVINAEVSAESIFGDKLSRTISCTIMIKKNNSNTESTEPAPDPNPVPTPSPVTTSPSTPPPTQQPGGNGNPGGRDSINILDFDVTGSWSHWEDEPHRFLALEKITITIEAEGPAEWAVIRMSPELEAMSYTNSSGHTYSYSDDFFGYTVDFPADSKIYPAYKTGGITVFVWEYCIPMCDETIGWDNVRKFESYEIQCRLFSGRGRRKSAKIKDIDITGNIYELLYPQPAD